MPSSAQYLVWLDLEMTGLHPETDRILEIATLITDNALQWVAEGPVFAISQDEQLLARMDDWNTQQHAASGLVDRVRTSTITESAAEQATLDFLKAWVEPQTAPLCGNSIYQDRRFLARYMPALEQFFHYRNIDVSTLKELAKRWAPTMAEQFQKTSQHLALADIKESIAELRYYRDHFIKVT